MWGGGGGGEETPVQFDWMVIDLALFIYLADFGCSFAGIRTSLLAGLG